MREARGLSQEKLGHMVGMSKSYLPEIERGKKEVNGRRLEAFAAAFGVRTVDLIDNAGSDEIREHVAILEQLPAEDREAIIRLAQSLLRRVSG